MEIELVKNSVLIIDDDHDTLELLANILEDDYTIYKESKAADAIETVKKMLPDLILLDKFVVAPLEMHNALKDKSETKDIPIIVLLEIDNIEDEDDEFLHGAIDYIQKPLPTIVVKSRVRNHIRFVNQKRLLDQLDKKDVITDMYGSKFFIKRINQEWHRAMRDDTTISVLILAINNYESFDKEQRNYVLREVSNLIRTNAKRSMDIAVRWEDDLFAVLLPNTPSYGAAVLAEIIRKSIEKSPIITKEPSLPIFTTVSILANSAKPDRNMAVDDFIEHTLDFAKKFKKEKINTIHTLN